MIVSVITGMLFLGLMLYCINFIVHVFRAIAARKSEAIRKEREIEVQNLKKTHHPTISNNAEEDIAVIAAAVTAYETKCTAQL